MSLRPSSIEEAADALSAEVETQPPPEPTTADELAAALHSAHMAAPASLLLGTLKPLAWVGSQFLWMLQPFVGSTGARTQSNLSIPGIARFFEKEGSVDDLLERLESPRGRANS
jgi:hypothetical protein